MITPQRIQLRRTKGWRKPDNTVVVARPSHWGNPFTVGTAKLIKPTADTATHRRLACRAFACWLAQMEETERRDYLTPLRGKNLACWCPLPAAGQPDYCHARILLEEANQ